MWYKKNMIQKGKVLPLFSYTKISLLLKNLPLHYPWGLGLPRWGVDFNARECSPHHCVVIETIFDWKMWFKGVEFVTAGPWNADTPHPRLLHWASQHQGQESNKGNQIKGLFTLSLPLPDCGTWGFLPKAPSCAEESFLPKFAILVSWWLFPGREHWAVVLPGRQEMCPKGAGLTAQPAWEDLALPWEIPWDKSWWLQIWWN